MSRQTARAWASKRSAAPGARTPGRRPGHRNQAVEEHAYRGRRRIGLCDRSPAAADSRTASSSGAAASSSDRRAKRAGRSTTSVTSTATAHRWERPMIAPDLRELVTPRGHVMSGRRADPGVQDLPRTCCDERLGPQASSTASPRARAHRICIHDRPWRRPWSQPYRTLRHRRDIADALTTHCRPGVDQDPFRDPPL